MTFTYVEWDKALKMAGDYLDSLKTEENTNMATDYRVISHHLDSGTRSRSFRTADAAKAYADSVNPDTDGSVYPNITEEEIASHTPRGFEYFAGSFWYGNRPAATLQRIIRHQAPGCD